MPCLTTRFLIGISISTQLSLFGIVETNPRKTCVCTTTLSAISSSPSSTETSTSPSMTKSLTSSAPSNTSTTTSTSSNTSSTTSTTPSKTSTTISTTPSNTSSTTSTTPSNTSTTTVRSNTWTTTPTTLLYTSTTARTTTSNSTTTTQKTPPNTSNATSTTRSNTSSATSPTLSNTSNTSSATSTIHSITSTTTSTTLSNTSSTTSKTPSNTSSATSTTPSNTSTTTSTSPINTSSTTSTTPSNQSSTMSATPFSTPSITGNSLEFRGPDGVCICSSTLEYISSTSNNNESVKVLSLDKVPVKVPLVVSINTDFKKELLDKSSMLYKKYKAELKSKLEVTYKDMDDFLRVDVLGFRFFHGKMVTREITMSNARINNQLGTNGCIACDYVVVLQPGSVLEDTDIQNKTDSLNSEEMFNISMQTENTSVVTDFKKLYKTSPCRTVDCGYGYSCANATSAFVTCKHVCSSWNMCKNDGLCLLDDRHELPFCRCKTDDKYTYSGDYCEVKNEKLALSKTYIIAIAAGSGGGLLTILVVIIIVLALKRKSSGNSKQRDDSVGHMKSVSMDDLRLDRMNDSRSSYEFLHRPRIHASENQYESGFPDTKYVQGREHRVMKDSRGDEEDCKYQLYDHNIMNAQTDIITYIYQPSSCIYPVSRTRDGSAYSSYVAGPSVYDYIDTESKFEIQRPNIRLGNMNKY